LTSSIYMLTSECCGPVVDGLIEVETTAAAEVVVAAAVVEDAAAAAVDAVVVGDGAVDAAVDAAAVCSRSGVEDVHC
jgi:hypothetical protein